MADKPIDPKAASDAAAAADRQAASMDNVARSAAELAAQQDKILQGAKETLKTYDELHANNGQAFMEKQVAWDDELKAQRQIIANSEAHSAAEVRLAQTKIANIKNERQKTGDLYNQNKEDLQEIIRLEGIRKGEIDASNDAMDEANAAQRAFGQQLEASVGSMTDLDVGMSSFGGKLVNSLRSAGGLKATFQALGGLATQMLSPWTLLASAISMAAEQDQLAAGLVKTTALTRTQSAELMKLDSTMSEFGMTQQDTAEIINNLSAEFTQFTKLSTEQQVSLKNNAAQMKALGVEASISSEAFNNYVNVMGGSIESTEGFNQEMVGLANTIGKDVNAVMRDLNAAMPDLAKHGDGAIEVFKGLSAIAAKTGVSVQSLINITKGFDTFEDAAGKVGKLNAMLGGPFLNSIDMVNMSETERIIAMKKSIEMSGRSWEAMNKHERQAIANAAGISDMAEAAKLFNANTTADSLRADAAAGEAAQATQEQMAERTKEAKSAMDQLKDSINRIIIALQPLITVFVWFMNILAAIIGWMPGWVVVILALALAWWKFAAASKAGGAGATTATSGLTRMASGLTAMAPALSAAAGPLALFSLALILFGVGAIAVAFAMWLLAQAFVTVVKGVLMLLPHIGPLFLLALAIGAMALAGFIFLPAAIMIMLGFFMIAAGLFALAIAMWFFGGGNFKALAQMFIAIADMAKVGAEPISEMTAAVLKLVKAFYGMRKVAGGVAWAFMFMAYFARSAARSFAFLAMFVGLVSGPFTMIAEAVAKMAEALAGINISDTLFTLASGLNEVGAALNRISLFRMFFVTVGISQLDRTLQAVAEIDASNVEPVKQVVDQAIRYSTNVSRSRGLFGGLFGGGADPFTKMLRALGDVGGAPAAAAGAAAGAKEIVIKLNDRELGRAVKEVFNDEMDARLK